MASEILGLAIGFSGGILRAVIGFVYAKARCPKLKFNPYLFSVTLIEGIVAGIVLGSLITVGDIATGVSLGLAAAGISEFAGKTGLHDRLK